jgi:hypothetical protein
MLDKAPPLAVAHERAALRYAWRKLRSWELLKVSARDPIFRSVVLLFSNSVEVDAEGVLGWFVADSSRPAVVVPGDADVEVMGHAADSTIAIGQVRLVQRRRDEGCISC